MPQVLLLISFWLLEKRPVGLDGNPELFIVTFVTSILSAGFGLTKFLKLGPCRLLGGYGKISFLLVMLNIIGVLLCKGFCLVVVNNSLSTNRLIRIIIWICTCLMPGFIYVRTIFVSKNICALTKSIFSYQANLTLFTTLGPRSAVKVIMLYPALVMMPTFTNWTFGPSNLKKCFTSCCRPKFLHVSFPLSWINLIITTLPPIIFSYLGAEIV